MNRFVSKFYLSFSIICLALFSVNAQEEATATATAASTYNDGLALLKAKNYEEGLPKMEEALVLGEEEKNEKVVKLAKKNGSIAAYNLGKAKAKADMLEEALAMYKKGTELNPEYYRNYLGLASIYKKQDKLDEAVEMYLKTAETAKAAEKSKGVESAMKRLKVLVGEQYVAKNFDAAIDYGTKTNAFQSVPDVHYYVSRAYTEKGEFQKALDEANKAIETGKAQDELEDKFYVAQAKAYVGLGNKAEAIKAYEMVQDGQYVEQAEYQIKQLKG